MKIIIVLILSCLLSATSFGQKKSGWSIMPSAIVQADTIADGVVEYKYYNSVAKSEYILGTWKKIARLNPTLNLLEEEDCPQGKYIVFYEDYANIFDYYDEDGSSIEFMFDYKIKDKFCKGTFTNSNAVLFEEKNKGKSFEFILQVFHEEGILIIITERKNIVTYAKYKK